MSDKKRFPRAIGLRVAKELCDFLKPHCVRLVCAGSLRRGKPDIGDVEILFIGKTEERPVPGDMFASKEFNLAELAIADMERRGVIGRRKTAIGSEVYGAKNKLMFHVETGLPVDLFTATEANWFNYLVCRTGPADSNTRIATLAQEKGWKWHPYGTGFSRTGGHSEDFVVRSEEDVFRFVGLPYLQPKDRK